MYYAANREEIAAKQRAYREANREELTAYQRAYYAANREAIKEKARAYYAANREEIAAKQRAYREAGREELAAGYAANREAIAAKRRAYRKANKDMLAVKARAYYEANRDKVSAYNAAYYAANRERINARRKKARQGGKESKMTISYDIDINYSTLDGEELRDSEIRARMIKNGISIYGVENEYGNINPGGFDCYFTDLTQAQEEAEAYRKEALEDADEGADLDEQDVHMYVVEYKCDDVDDCWYSCRTWQLTDEGWIEE